MLEPMGGVIDDTVEVLLKSKGEINLKPVFQEMALKVVAVTTMGVHLDADARDIDRQFIECGRALAANYVVLISCKVF